MRKIRLLDILHPTIFFLWFYFLYLGLSMGLNTILVNVSFINLYISSKTIFILLLYPVLFIFSSHIFTILLFQKKPMKVRLDLVNDLNKNKVYFFGIIFLLAGILLFTLTYSKIGFIPLFMEDADSGRVSAKAGLGKYILLGTAFIYVSMIFMFSYYNYFNRLKKISLLVFLIIGSLFIVGIGFRGPVAYLLLYILLVRFFISSEYKRKQQIPYRFLFYGILFLLLLSVADFIRHGNSFSLDAFAQIYWTITVNLYNLNNIIEHFNSDNYFYGKSFITDILVAIPGTGEKFLGVTLKDLIGLDFAGEGMTVTAPGEGYVNGGVVGVVFHALFFGFLFGTTYEYFSRKNTVSKRLLFLIITISFSKVVVGGFMPMLIFTLTPTILIALFFIYLTKEKNENIILCKT